MRVSKKTYYGLRAVLALAQSRQPLSTHTLAILEHLPEDYLEKILQALRKAGLVMAHKGVAGGYILARLPQDITMWDIVETLDGPVKTFEPPTEKHGPLPASNAWSTASAGWPCPQVSHCQSNEVWRLLEESIEKTLSKITLEHIIPKA